MSAISLGLSLWPKRPAVAAFDLSGTALPAGASLTRASSGTRYDAGGALVTDAANVARFDRDPATLAMRGLLYEESRINRFVQSDDLTSASWTRSGASAASATRLIEDASTGTHSVSQSRALTSGTAYTISVVAAETGAGSKRYAQLYFSSTAFGTSRVATFDLAAGTMVMSAGLSAGIEPAGGGARLIWASGTASSSGTGAYVMLRLTGSFAAMTSVANYAGDGVSGLTVLHQQIEDGAGVTSRIVTGAAAVTRAADALALNWTSVGVADGTVPVRCIFDDGSTQTVSMMVSGGVAMLPTALARRWVRRVERA